MLRLNISNKILQVPKNIHQSFDIVVGNCKARPRIGAFLYKSSNDHDSASSANQNKNNLMSTTCRKKHGPAV